MERILNFLGLLLLVSILLWRFFPIEINGNKIIINGKAFLIIIGIFIMAFLILRNSPLISNNTPLINEVENSDITMTAVLFEKPNDTSRSNTYNLGEKNILLLYKTCAFYKVRLTDLHDDMHEGYLLIGAEKENNLVLNKVKGFTDKCQKENKNPSNDTNPLDIIKLTEDELRKKKEGTPKPETKTKTRRRSIHGD